MKRALLIAGGTVGGLGAVLSITPPQLSSPGMTGLSSVASRVSSNAGTVASTTTTQTTTVAVPQAATPVAATAAATPASSATKPITKKKTTVKVTAKKKTTAKKVTSAKVASTITTNNSNVSVTVSTPPVTPTPTKTVAPAPANKGVSGTFVGSTVDVSYGSVQVQITVVNGKITDARALQAPSGRSDRFTQYAVPVLIQQTLAAQSSKIQGASGASYTSWGWYTSLQAALAKAGL